MSISAQASADPTIQKRLPYSSSTLQEEGPTAQRNTKPCSSIIALNSANNCVERVCLPRVKL